MKKSHLHPGKYVTELWWATATDIQRKEHLLMRLKAAHQDKRLISYCLNNIGLFSAFAKESFTVIRDGHKRYQAVVIYHYLCHQERPIGIFELHAVELNKAFWLADAAGIVFPLLSDLYEVKADG